MEIQEKTAGLWENSGQMTAEPGPGQTLLESELGNGQGDSQRDNQRDRHENSWEEIPEDAAFEAALTEEETAVTAALPEQEGGDDWEGELPFDQQNPEQAAEEKENPQRIQLSVDGQMQELTWDEALSLAKKGLSYDTLQETVQSLEREKQAGDALTVLLQESAQRAGMHPEAYWRHLRAMELRAGGLSGEAADLQAQLEHQAVLGQAKERFEKAKEEQAQLRRFVRQYPDVDPQEIPPQVWEAVRQGETLGEAYAGYEAGRLRTQLAALQKEEENRRRSTGSRSAVGMGDAGDSFLEGFSGE